MSSRGITAAQFSGLGPDLTTRQERMNVLAAVRNGELRVLYLHNHFLQDHDFISAMNEAQGELSLLVFDEANAAPSVRMVPSATRLSASRR